MNEWECSHLDEVAEFRGKETTEERCNNIDSTEHKSQSTNTIHDFSNYENLVCLAKYTIDKMSIFMITNVLS